MFYLAEEALHEMPMTDNGRFLLGMVQLTRYLYRRRQTELRKQPQVDLDAALALWDGLEERREMVLPLVHATIELLSNLGDPRQMIATARKNLALTKRHGDLAGAAISLTTLATGYFMAFGDFSTAQQFLEEALESDRQIGFALNAQWSEAVLGNIASIRGRYGAANGHFEASVRHHHVEGISNNLDRSLILLGKNALDLADDASASNQFAEGMTVASRHQRYEQIAESQAGLGILAAFQGDLTAAAAHYDDARTNLQSAGLNTFHTSDVSESVGFLALLLGHYHDALAHYEAILARYRDTGYRIPLMCAHCRAGQALLGLTDETRSKPHLFEALREAAVMGAYQVLLETLLGIAQLSIVPPTLAVELLALVCKHSASNRYSRTQAERLLAKMNLPLSQDDRGAALERGQALTLEAAVALVEPLDEVNTAELTTNQPLNDPLSQREHAVLTLVAAGLTNQEIADELYIGISTVKKHINHLYSKLDVTHRAEAVAHARALKILP